MGEKKLEFFDYDSLLYSKYLSCEWKKEKSELEIYMGRDNRNIPYATKDLQKDYSNFESIAFCVWSKLPKCKITLKYETIKWYGNKTEVFPLNFDDYDTCFVHGSAKSGMQHYMRFLYRVMKMSELYGNRFTVDESNRKEIEVFTKAFVKNIDNRIFTMTEPGQKSSVTGKSEIKENHLEKWFMHYSGSEIMAEKCPEFVTSSSGNIKLYDQFPCGLFAGAKSEKTRIFSGGAFDLWGIDKNNNLCLYELKEKSNTHLGIISELFFYSCLMSDFKKIAPDTGTEVRGFSKFIRANNNIQAYFLVPGFHPFIEKNKSEIIREMNKRNDNVTYDFIIFDQSKIVGTDVNDFLTKLKEQVNE